MRIIFSSLALFLLSLPCNSNKSTNSVHAFNARAKGLRYNSVGQAKLKSLIRRSQTETKTIENEETQSISEEAEQAKKDMLDLSISSDRGFKASSADRKRAKEIVEILERNNPTLEPAAAYYSNNDNIDSDITATLSGKWTLIYTDAPDITSLSSTPTAQLGNVGQECNPPMIKNVIEWKRPEWASSLPFSGDNESRILQKVCCEGIATPDKADEVDLKIVGLDLLGLDSKDSNLMKGTDNSIAFDGPAAFLKRTGPVELRGFLKPPFGKFRVLYLDNDMRVIRTVQGYLAVNIRQEKDKEWF